MNKIWSTYIQGTKTLYHSRKLRFDDRFSGQYRALFELDAAAPLNILEVGCGPGALAGALHRWYPRAHITGIDRDSRFIAFARANEPGIDFLEGDAANLPFSDATFDATLSYTVSEHIPPEAFYGEQLRVLKPGGVCLVLSARKGLNPDAPCMESSEAEKQFWQKVQLHDDTLEKYAVGRYAMNESQLPAAMQAHGFRHVQTGYAIADLTPDDPKYPPAMAHAMINARRYTELDAIESVPHTMPGIFAPQEIETMLRLTNERYNRRIALYDRGEKQWDTGVSVTMVIRGVR